MTAPTPRQFDIILAQAHARITDEMKQLPELYSLAHGASVWKVSREQGGKISRGGVSKPTEAIVGDPRDPRRPGAQAGIRKALERAEKHLADAENAVVAARVDIEKAMDRLSPRETFVHERTPFSVNKAELEVLGEARLRRRERGEHLG